MPISILSFFDYARSFGPSSFLSVSSFEMYDNIIKRSEKKTLKTDKNDNKPNNAKFILGSNNLSFIVSGEALMNTLSIKRDVSDNDTKSVEIRCDRSHLQSQTLY